MADWSGAEAYARSYGVVCAEAVPPLLDLLGGPPGALLDVGAGPGTLALAAAARGWRVTAIEPEAAMRDLARAAGSTRSTAPCPTRRSATASSPRWPRTSS